MQYEAGGKFSNCFEYSIVFIIFMLNYLDKNQMN